MKKGIVTLLCVFVAALAGPARAALPNYSELVSRQDGSHDAALTATWEGDASPVVLLPAPAKGVLKAVRAVGATPGEAVVGKVNGLTVLQVPLDGGPGTVTLSVDWEIPGLYEPATIQSGADLSGRGDQGTVKYAIHNTTGLGFGNASLTFTLPQGMRLFELKTRGATFALEEDSYNITRTLSGKSGAPGLAPGARLDLEFSMLPPAGGGRFLLWGVVIALSCCFLYFKRDSMPTRTNRSVGAV